MLLPYFLMHDFNFMLSATCKTNRQTLTSTITAEIPSRRFNATQRLVCSLSHTSIYTGLYSFTKIDVSCHRVFLAWDFDEKKKSKPCSACWVMACFPAVCRDEKASLERGIGLRLVHISLVTFVTRDGVWGLQTWPPEPLCLTLFSPASPFLHVFVCVRVCVRVCVHTHRHSSFHSCCSVILCRDEAAWAGPDLSCREPLPDLVFKSTFTAMHRRFLWRPLGFSETKSEMFELRLPSVSSSLFRRLPSQCINS